MAWCGYIDMLGTRATVQRSRQDLTMSLHAFHSALLDAFPKFVGGRCFAFSDGAFLVSPDVHSFSMFYRRVRNELFQKGIYFRASLIKGTIDVVRNSSLVPSKRKPKDGMPDFFSLTFAGDAPKAYQHESEFKGVGCTVEPHVHTDVISSAFVKMSGSSVKSYRYYDFRYSPFELSGPHEPEVAPTYEGEVRLFDKLISSCHATLMQSSSVASYYVSALITMVRSLDLSRTEHNEDKGWVNAPYVFRELMSDGVPRVLRGLPGLNLLYLSCYDHLFHEHKQGIPAAAETIVLRRLLRIPGCFKNLDQVPEAVITGQAKHRLIQIKVSDALAAHGRDAAPPPV